MYKTKSKLFSTVSSKLLNKLTNLWWDEQILGELNRYKIPQIQGSWSGSLKHFIYFRKKWSYNWSPINLLMQFKLSSLMQLWSLYILLVFKGFKDASLLFEKSTEFLPVKLLEDGWRVFRSSSNIHLQELEIWHLIKNIAKKWRWLTI